MGRFAEQAESVITTLEGCDVGRLVEGFDEEDEAYFVKLLKARKLTTIRSIVGNGAPSEKTLRNHSRGQCRCPEGTVAKGVTHG